MSIDNRIEHDPLGPVSVPIIPASRHLRDALVVVAAALNNKAEEFAVIRKLGRTKQDVSKAMFLNDASVALPTRISE